MRKLKRRTESREEGQYAGLASRDASCDIANNGSGWNGPRDFEIVTGYREKHSGRCGTCYLGLTMTIGDFVRFFYLFWSLRFSLFRPDISLVDNYYTRKALDPTLKGIACQRHPGQGRSAVLLETSGPPRSQHVLVEVSARRTGVHDSPWEVTVVLWCLKHSGVEGTGDSV